MITETGKRAKDATISDLGIKKAIVHWNLSPKELVDIAIDNQQAKKKSSSLFEDLLSAGLIIGGAYLLGNALSSPSTAITPSPSIINKIQPSNSLIYGPYDTPFGY